MTDTNAGNKATLTDCLPLLSSEAAGHGITISAEQLRQFECYMKELTEWNERMNLTSITAPEDMVIKHLIDSLTPLKFIRRGNSLLDIGAGAGFPGIPLKIVEPSLCVTLIDSVNKKVTFMKHVISELGLTAIEAIHVRAEDLVKTKKMAYDAVISRALTNLSDFVKLGGPFLKHGGFLIAMKGKEVEEEIENASGMMVKNRIRVVGVDRLSLPMGKGERTIIIMERI